MSLKRIVNSSTPTAYQTGLQQSGKQHSTPILPSIKRKHFNFTPINRRGHLDTSPNQSNHPTLTPIQKQSINLSTDIGRRSLSKQVVQHKLSSQKSYKARLKQHQFSTFQALKFVQKLPQLDEDYISSKMVYLKKRVPHIHTVIFDLDQTLVHSTNDPSDGQFTVRIPMRDQRITLGLNIRPYVRELLEQTSRMAEIMVFTASEKVYADIILDLLDPDGRFIQHRLYRENCIRINGVYLKDLRILANRDIRLVTIVDNLACSFGYQIDNGVPILSWYDDPSDRELLKLSAYLNKVIQASDVRNIHRSIFKLRDFVSDYNKAFIKRSNSQVKQDLVIRRTVKFNGMKDVRIYFEIEGFRVL